MVDNFWAVIPAGGAGTRLWPLSRAGAPKFLHDLTGSGRTLLQATVDRVAALADERIVVVTGVAHREAVQAQVADEGVEVLAEPTPRDSMAAIGWAAALIEARDPDAVIGSFAADHVIADSDGFAACVEQAIAVARDGWLVTLGVRPTFASTGFGYISGGEPLADHVGCLAVEAFVEKPDAETAAAYVAAGHLWNAGMFVARPSVILDLLAVEHPEFTARLRRLAAGHETLDEAWPELTKIAIDHAIAEPAAAAGKVAVVPASFSWDDIGDFASLRALLTPSDGVAVVGDDTQVIAPHSSGVVVPHGGRVVAVVGLPGVVVVDTPDALLVTTLDHAQDVKKIVETLKATGRTDLT